MAVVGAVAAVVGAGVQFKASRDVASAQRERGKVVGAQQRGEDRANLREQARQERIQRARIAQAAETTGGGSREIGATASLSTQVSANVGRIRGQQTAAEGVSDLNQDIASAQVQKSLGAGIQQIGTTAFTTAGGFDTLFK